MLASSLACICGSDGSCVGWLWLEFVLWFVLWLGMALIACLMVLMACVMDCIARMLASFGMCYRLQGFVCVGGLRSGLNGSRYGLICCAWRYFICLGFGMCLWFGLFLCLIGKVVFGALVYGCS